MEIKTKDLWQSAYVLAEGGSLKQAELGERSKGEVFFVLDGSSVEELARQFRSGQALCNVSRLKASMSHLKEVMFETLRNAS